jgi:hypothetical protein
MSPDALTPATRAELMKLARLLDVEVEDLDYLHEVDPEALRALREQVTEVIYDSGGAALGRLAMGSRLLPTGVLAAIAEHAFGPVLAARIAGLLEPGRAADVAAKLPTPFLAEVAVHLDPRRAVDVLARIPAQRVAEVARELIAAQEHVTLGRFVSHLPDEGLTLAVRAMDNLTVLTVAFVVEERNGIERVLALMDGDRYDRLLDAAIGTELWPEVLELLDEVREPLRTRVLGSRAAGSAPGA